MKNHAYHSSVWHPFTQHGLTPVLKCIAKTEGAYLIDKTGERILDAISSWWVITHSHRHPFIMQAIRNALENWDQIIFSEFTHEPAEALAKALIALAPTGMRHVFYSDSGSTSVEVALKMALGFFKHIHSPRSRIVVMAHGYHGDTIGTMSVGERSIFNTPYEKLLFKVKRLPFPLPGQEQHCLDQFEILCRTGEVAALLIEPLVLGAGGFKIYPGWVLKELKSIAATHHCLLIADEVMTGWGRTGSLFACEQAEISPDILCTAKGLTGGTLPLAATLCTSEIFNAHFSRDRCKTFFHSSSYTANPIACAAALANIEIWRNEPVYDRIQQIQKLHHYHLLRFQSDDRFENIRQVGTIAAFDLRVEKPGYLASVGPLIREAFREKKILVRPLGNVIYFMPPYCITAKEIDFLYETIDEVTKKLSRAAL